MTNSATDDPDLIFAGSAGLQEALDNGRRLLAASPAAAAGQAREILRVTPRQGDALRLLANALRRLGENAEAERIEVEAIRASSYNPLLVQAAQAITDNRLNEAEHLLRPYLAGTPDDAAAIRMLAEIGARAGSLADAEELLRRALALAPGFAAARLRLAKLLYEQNRVPESLSILDELLESEPEHAGAGGAKAATLGRIGEYHQALSLYEQLLDRLPDRPGIWMSYGHVLSTVGRVSDSIAAYRQALTLDPDRGEAWWSLANLKTVRFDASDIQTMKRAIETGIDSDAERVQMHFALGKGLEDAGEYQQSFDHYAQGNAGRRATFDYDADRACAYVHRHAQVFGRDLFAEQSGNGNPSPDPIFIIGMPRAGSTLIEQILSSHSMIEGTSELPYVPLLTRRLEADEPGSTYPDLVASLNAKTLRLAGDEYLASAALHRKTDKPMFIDKLPNNWLNIGLIQLILPNARIIDARRHPLGCCFSNFKQHFASGQLFSYALDDLGRYYADYVGLMDHFDQILPGTIHRVLHEAMVDDSEREVRRLLDYLGLPFEEPCLRFYENDRAVRTPSAGQVRVPINRQGVDQWKSFDPWLDPLKQALGPVLDRYPLAPRP